ncbi:alanyl-tRNA editing protein [Mariluticola halotolerans]|uniref:alanyl-tRNA editing protein n=1 Tax=Mariluticola halotolerans TaxID=2909283 RepID=UPI0026E3C6DC|nr:alanyl-tRNA editing protein [Mariluticola halotolerans]UJQ95570.1 alanyl-tRNA editing protein [Mariluticola halotolerans]
MSTAFLFRDDAYLKTATATVAGMNDLGGILLDQTIFYANSGGQPGDSGRLMTADGREIVIATTVHPDGDKTAIVHVPAPDQTLPAIGETVTLVLDWDKRYRLMRMHTALHLLSVVFPFPVTGGSIGADKGRLDFDMPEVPEDIPALETALNDFVRGEHDVTAEWITDAEMAAQQDLIKTMKVKPPMGQGRVRLIRIGAGETQVDLQPCGGTHVANTREIGPLRIGKIEKKGKENRRVSLFFAE